MHCMLLRGARRRARRLCVRQCYRIHPRRVCRAHIPRTFCASTASVRDPQSLCAFLLLVVMLYKLAAPAYKSKDGRPPRVLGMSSVGLELTPCDHKRAFDRTNDVRSSHRLATVCGIHGRASIYPSSARRRGKSPGVDDDPFGRDDVVTRARGAPIPTTSAKVAATTATVQSQG